MSAESCESFSSLDSEVMEVTAEGDVKVEVKSAPNNMNSTVKEEKKNNVFDFSSSSDGWQPVNSQEGMKKEAVNEKGGKKLVFANGSIGEKLDRRKLKKMKMKPFPLSGIQVFKQVLYR